MSGGNCLPNNLPILDGKSWERWHKQKKKKTLFRFQDSPEVVINGVPTLPANATVHRGTCVERQRGKIAKPCI
jgi:hypothetical protein